MTAAPPRLAAPLRGGEPPAATAHRLPASLREDEPPTTSCRQPAEDEDALTLAQALARYRARQSAGEATAVPHERVRDRLGLARPA